MASRDWFQVDKEGLGKLLEQRGKEFAIFELIQNAWDAIGCTLVSVELHRDGPRHALLTIEDNSPDGFADLTHSYTLFAESTKKANPEKRGRFNLGEKLVLALCETAKIVSTKGGVMFDENGRHTLRSKRNAGTVFEGRIRMSAEEYDECCKAVWKLIPPPGISTFFNKNGMLRDASMMMTQFNASLKTEIADEQGVMRSVSRRTDVTVYVPHDGEVGMLYEMGIPVVETGDTFHVNVMQRVPVNFDRNNVPPAYLRALRTQTLNALHEHLTAEHVTKPWVRDALADPNVSVEAVQTALTLRFGEKAVAYDPSDPEANNIAVAEGYTVVHGGTMSSEEWANARRAEALLPAGVVTPSPKPFSPGGKPLKVLAPEKWSDDVRAFVEKTKRLARVLMNVEVDVEIANDPTWPFGATWGASKGGRAHMYINRGRLGESWFALMGAKQIDLVIHEFGHEYSDNHLSEDYYHALTKLAGLLAVAVKANPTLID